MNKKESRLPGQEDQFDGLCVCVCLQVHIVNYFNHRPEWSDNDCCQSSNLMHVLALNVINCFHYRVQSLSSHSVSLLYSGFFLAIQCKYDCLPSIVVVDHNWLTQPTFLSFFLSRYIRLVWIHQTGTSKHVTQECRKHCMSGLCLLY